MFKQPFSFDGRIRRTEYGLSILIYVIASITTMSILPILGNSTYGLPLILRIWLPLMLLIWFPLIWFMLAQATKRCHDLGNSGWYQLIPLYGFWLLFADGEEGENYYGLNPKGIGNDSENDEIEQHLIG